MNYDSSELLGFSVETRRCGDADGDGTVSVLDARSILRVAVGLEAASTAVEAAAADCDGNTLIDVTDARAALRYAVGLDKEMPAFLTFSPV